MHGWMDRQTDKQTDRKINGQINRYEQAGIGWEQVGIDRNSQKIDRSRNIQTRMARKGTNTYEPIRIEKNR